MKFLCDVHVSLKLSKKLEKLGCESEHVNNILNGFYTKDGDISKYADNNNLVLITKDQDFRNSYLVKKTPKKLIKINLGNIPNNELITLFTEHLDIIRQVNNENETFMIEMGKENFWSVIK